MEPLTTPALGTGAASMLLQPRAAVGELTRTSPEIRALQALSVCIYASKPAVEQLKAHALNKPADWQTIIRNYLVALRAQRSHIVPDGASPISVALMSSVASSPYRFGFIIGHAQFEVAELADLRENAWYGSTDMPREYGLDVGSDHIEFRIEEPRVDGWWAVSTDTAVTVHLGNPADASAGLGHRTGLGGLHRLMQFARRYCSATSPASLRKPYTYSLLNEQCIADALAWVTKLGVAPPERLVDLFAKCFGPYASGAATTTALERGIYFSGPPGSGKTTFAQTLMEKLGCRILCNGSAPSLSFKDGAEAAIKILTQLFEMATHTPHLLCCVFLDEVEAIALQKGKSPEDRGIDGVLSHLNTLITDPRYSNVMVLAATNAPESLDDAFTRPGRVSNHLYVGYKAAEACAAWIDGTLQSTDLRMKLDWGCGFAIDPVLRVNVFHYLCIGWTEARLRGVKLEQRLKAHSGCVPLDTLESWLLESPAPHAFLARCPRLCDTSRRVVELLNRELFARVHVHSEPEDLTGRYLVDLSGTAPRVEVETFFGCSTTLSPVEATGVAPSEESALIIARVLACGATNVPRLSHIVLVDRAVLGTSNPEVTLERLMGQAQRQKSALVVFLLDSLFPLVGEAITTSDTQRSYTDTVTVLRETTTRHRDLRLLPVIATHTKPRGRPCFMFVAKSAELMDYAKDASALCWNQQTAASRECLDLSGMCFSAAMLQCIRSYTNLRQLRLTHCGLDDAKLQQILSPPFGARLSKVDVSGNPALTTACVALFLALPCARTLTLITDLPPAVFASRGCYCTIQASEFVP